jgi:hypothetical protein
MVGTLDQQTSEIDVAGLCDAELRVSISGLTASRSQAEVTTYISTSLKAFRVDVASWRNTHAAGQRRSEIAQNIRM